MEFLIRNNMAKITYLLGAGASANCLPLVSEFSDRLIIYKNYLLRNFPHKNIEDYIKELLEIIANSSENTIDGYARNLHQNQSADIKKGFNRLKAIIVGFFLFEQMKKRILNFETDEIDNYNLPPEKKRPEKTTIDKIINTIDKRYLSFIGKVLTNENKLHPQINIISWNYDMQFEIAMENIGIEYKHLDAHINIFPYPTTMFFHELTKSGDVHNILKLNGTAGIFRKKEQIMTVYETQREYFDDIIDIVMNIYNESKSRYSEYNPLFKFAWEKNQTADYILECAQRMIWETEVLVIVGYSFPDFNRDIDRAIFSNSSNIKKVYLQANNDSNVPLNIRALKNDFLTKMEIIQGTGNFFLPPEF